MNPAGVFGKHESPDESGRNLSPKAKTLRSESGENPLPKTKTLMKGVRAAQNPAGNLGEKTAPAGWETEEAQADRP